MVLANTAFTPKEMFHILQAALPDCMVVFLDGEGKVLFHSSTLLGCENCTTCNVGQSIYDHSSCRVFDIFKMWPKERLGRLEAAVETLATVIDTLGKTRTLRTTLTPLGNPSCGVVAFLFSVTDQTALATANQALSLQKELLKNVLHKGMSGDACDLTQRRLLEEHLQLTRFSVEKAIVPIFWVDREAGRITYANEAACQSLGYTKEELVQMTVVDIDPNFDQDKWDTHVKSLNKSQALHFETLHQRKDGSVFPVEVFASIFAYQGVDYNIAFAINISERLEKEQALARNEAVLRESQRIAKIGSWEHDIKGEKLAWSEEVCRIFGFDETVVPSFENFLRSIHPEDRDMVMSAYQNALDDSTKPYDVVHRIVVHGAVRYVHEQGEVRRDALGKPFRSVGTVRDITDERVLMDQIEYLSLHDPLTKLPNQLLLKRELGHALERAEKTKTLVAVCFIDLDDFKYINDLYSHETGDAILQEIARRLQKVANHSHALARFGADEFVVIIEEVKGPAHVIVKLNLFLDALKQPVVMDGHTHVLSASVGISLSPTDAREVEELINSTFAHKT